MSVARNDAEKLQLTVATGAGSATKITLTGLAAIDNVKAVINLTDLAQVSLAGLVTEADGFKITGSFGSGFFILDSWPCLLTYFCSVFAKPSDLRIRPTVT